MLSQSKTVPSTLIEISEIIQPRDLSYDYAFTVEKIFEIADEPLVISIQHLLQNIRGTRKAAYKLWFVGTKISESSPER